VRYRLRHATLYRYAEPVDLAGHLLHLTPRALPQQAVLAARIHADPPPARTVTRQDHFGNAVGWLFLDARHRRFEVVLEAEVAVAFPPPPAAAATPAWERVAAAAAEGEAAEFVFPSPLLPADPAAAAFAAASFPPGCPVLAGLLDLTSRIRRGFAFRPGATTVATPVARVMAQRAGVCQDFAHVMIAGLRALGLPARYVSGYLRTHPPPGQAARRGADQSHAWVGAWLGPGLGWVDLDPTNDLVVREEHVVLGWGRDFADVSPVRGVILGGGVHDVTAGVDLEPAAD
jgi:transglutaminase-like putative cysteine protease